MTRKPHRSRHTTWLPPLPAHRFGNTCASGAATADICCGVLHTVVVAKGADAVTAMLAGGLAATIGVEDLAVAAISEGSRQLPRSKHSTQLGWGQRRRSRPLRRSRLVPSGKAPALATMSVPALTTVPPAKALSPERLTVPLVSLVRPPGPERSALTVPALSWYAAAVMGPPMRLPPESRVRVPAG